MDKNGFIFCVFAAYLVTWSITSALYDAAVKRRHRAKLLAKYGDPLIVAKILEQTIWQGEIAEMLLDSAGQPDDIDHKVFKSKSREIWKYTQTGGNRSRNRITLENGIVIGWDFKSLFRNEAAPGGRIEDFA